MGGTVRISRESTAKSASLPGSRLPFSFSANSAYAAVRISALHLVYGAGLFKAMPVATFALALTRHHYRRRKREFDGVSSEL
jgi:hypothetical protein